MIVLGISCNWGARRVSYAVLNGTKENPQEIEIDDIRLSEDAGITSFDLLKQVFNKISNICKTRRVQSACLFAPGGWVTPRRRPGIPPAHPMKIRIETAAALSIMLSGVRVEAKDTRKIASDIGLPLEENLREKIRKIAKEKLPAAKDDQLDAVVAAFSILG